MERKNDNDCYRPITLKNAPLNSFEKPSDTHYLTLMIYNKS